MKSISANLLCWYCCWYRLRIFILVHPQSICGSKLQSDFSDFSFCCIFILHILRALSFAFCVRLFTIWSYYFTESVVTFTMCILGQYSHFSCALLHHAPAVRCKNRITSLSFTSALTQSLLICTCHLSPLSSGPSVTETWQQKVRNHL